MSDLIERLVRLTDYWNARDALTGFKAVEMACETIVVTNSAAWRIKQLEERIAELEAHANELAATCQARDETIHKHWCKVMELESEVARLRVDGTLLDNDRVVNAVSWTLCLQDGCDEDSARNLIWQGNPPEPYGEVWQTYEARAREVLKAAIDAAKEQS